MLRPPFFRQLVSVQGVTLIGRTSKRGFAELVAEWDVLFPPIQVRSATVQHRRHGGVNGRGKGRGQGL